MAELVFYDDRHVYELDGVKVPSVSEILRFGSRELYGDIDQYTLDNAADRGVRVHAACEALDTVGTCEIERDIEGYVAAYSVFLDDHKPVWTAIEKIVSDTGRWYAGRLDRAGRLRSKPGKTSLLDIKTTSQIQKRTVVPQLTAYAEAWETTGEPIDLIAALHLKKDGTYRLRFFERDPALWSAYLTIHQSFKKRGER